jgi:flagellar biosynthesis/type III secretory pathway protein FliH
MTIQQVEGSLSAYKQAEAFVEALIEEYAESAALSTEEGYSEEADEARASLWSMGYLMNQLGEALIASMKEQSDV